MNLPPHPMFTTDWAQISPIRHAGESGFALWRTQNFGDIRVRLLEYSPGYRADHWCSKGHILFCLSGSLEVEPSIIVCHPERSRGIRGSRPNQSYQVGDGDPPTAPTPQKARHCLLWTKV